MSYPVPVVSGADEELKFIEADLDSAASPVRSETHVSGSGPGRNKIFAVLGLAVAAVVAWSILSSSGDDAREDTAGPAPSSADASTADASTGDDGETGAVADDDGQDIPDAPEVLPAPEGRIEPALPGVESSGLPVLSPSGDLVGSDLIAPRTGPIVPESDLSLILNDFSGEVDVVGLDSGEVSKHRLLSGELILQVDDHLIFQDQVGGFAMIVDAAELDGTVIRIEPPSPLAVAVGAWSAGEGFATILSTTFGDEPVLTESTVDLATGVVTNNALVEPARGQDILLSAYAANREVFSPPTGGVYVGEDDGSFTKVLDGRALVADDRFVLVQSCDASLMCVRQWHDADTFEAITRAVPEDAFELGLLVGKGRVIVYVVPGEKALSIFDIDRNRKVPIDSSLLGFGPAVSPDGSVIAFFDGESSDVVVLDLDTLEESRLDFASSRGALAFATIDVR